MHADPFTLTCEESGRADLETIHECILFLVAPTGRGLARHGCLGSRRRLLWWGLPPLFVVLRKQPRIRLLCRIWLFSQRRLFKAL